jgi:regulation of enolase protein 1 (concanavalin A-like superfamily)
MFPPFTAAHRWINEPSRHCIRADTCSITTEPGTDLWQRTYYGFRNTNAHGLLFSCEDNLTFSVEALFAYQRQFDQCGVLVWIDEENWFKASVEHETDEVARLGSVVTNHGHSDWATTDVAPVHRIRYRLSRRGPDFLIESSLDGPHYRQMRIFHLAALGDTTPEMAKSDPPLSPEQPIELGVYACSPLDSSFEAVFQDPLLTACQWEPHR